MAFDKYKDGAWQEPEDGAKRYASGAWQLCESAKRYISNAWQEIWAAIKWMSVMNSTFTSSFVVGYSSSSEHDHTCWSMWILNERTNSAHATYYLDGNWTNPKITFAYDGRMARWLSDGNYTEASAGKIQIYSVNSSGTALNTNAVTSIKGEGTYEVTLTGTFTRLGYTVTFQDWGVTDADYTIDIWNFTIDGVECLPSADCEM